MTAVEVVSRNKFHDAVVTQGPDTVITYVRAVYAFQSPNNEDLNFPKGAIISILDLAYKNWARGLYQERLGCFPVNYVEPCRRVKALFDFTASEYGELTFRKGDIITVLEEFRGWWRGALNGFIGILPNNYVEYINNPLLVSANGKMIYWPAVTDYKSSKEGKGTEFHKDVARQVGSPHQTEREPSASWNTHSRPAFRAESTTQPVYSNVNFRPESTTQPVHARIGYRPDSTRQVHTDHTRFRTESAVYPIHQAIADRTQSTVNSSCKTDGNQSGSPRSTIVEAHFGDFPRLVDVDYEDSFLCPLESLDTIIVASHQENLDRILDELRTSLDTAAYDHVDTRSQRPPADHVEVSFLLQQEATLVTSCLRKVEALRDKQFGIHRNDSPLETRDPHYSGFIMASAKTIQTLMALAAYIWGLLQYYDQTHSRTGEADEDVSIDYQKGNNSNSP